MVVMSMQLKGGKALAKVLDGLKGTTARKAVRPAVRSSLSIVNKAAKSLAPTATKRLKRSIGIVMVPAAKMRNKGTIIGMVGPRVGGQHGSKFDKSTFAARYGIFREIGTEKLPAKPYIAISMARNTSPVLRKLSGETWKGIKKIAARERQKAGKR